MPRLLNISDTCVPSKCNCILTPQFFSEAILWVCDTAIIYTEIGCNGLNAEFSYPWKFQHKWERESSFWNTNICSRGKGHTEHPPTHLLCISILLFKFLFSSLRDSWYLHVDSSLFLPDHNNNGLVCHNFNSINNSSFIWGKYTSSKWEQRLLLSWKCNSSYTSSLIPCQLFPRS